MPGRYSAAMVSVIIPTLNPGTGLLSTLEALVSGAVGGVVRQVVVVDGGSTDDTVAISEAAGAEVIRAQTGRGHQLAAGAKAARGDWLLFLHADTILDPGWVDEVGAFIAEGGNEMRAGYFRFRLDHGSWRARVLEWIVVLRCQVLALPYGDQGLLISRALYDQLGGFGALPLMEDVEFVRRIGRRRLRALSTIATSSARRYRADGYVRRMARNLACLVLYFLGVAPQRLVRLYR